MVFLEKMEILAFLSSLEACIKSWMFLVTSWSSVSITILAFLVKEITLINILKDMESFCSEALSQEEAPKIAMDSALSILISFKAFLEEGLPFLTKIFKRFFSVPVSKKRSSISSWISSLFLFERITIVLLPLMKESSLTRFGPTADHSKMT